MTSEEMARLRPGQIIRNKDSGLTYIVHQTDVEVITEGGYFLRHDSTITAIGMIKATQPHEWEAVNHYGTATTS